jgi:hypothetical protein
LEYDAVCMTPFDTDIVQHPVYTYDMEEGDHATSELGFSGPLFDMHVRTSQFSPPTTIELVLDGQRHDLFFEHDEHRDLWHLAFQRDETGTVDTTIDFSRVDAARLEFSPPCDRKGSVCVWARCANVMEYASGMGWVKFDSLCMSVQSPGMKSFLIARGC